MASRAEDLLREIQALTGADQTAYIEAWVISEQREHEYLEFKGSGGDDKDAQSWSKALSAFGNTEGGLLVWGIDARPKRGQNPEDRAIDCAQQLKPVKDTRRHIQLLKDKFRDSINEPIHGIEHLAIPAASGAGGYVISYVPEGRSKPYRAERLTGRPYYQRVVDSNEIISHNLLRSLFYPRLHPTFHIKVRLDPQPRSLTITGTIRNSGTATAEDMIVRLQMNKHVEMINGGSGVHVSLIQEPPQLILGARLRPSFPLHPGDDIELFHLAVTVAREQEYLGLTMRLAVFTKDHAPTHFRQEFHLTDLGWPKLVLELDQIEDP